MDEEDKSKLDNDEEEVIDDQLQEDDSQEDLQDDDAQDDSQEEEQEEDASDDADDDDSKEEESKEEKPSRREQLRINDLLRKYGKPQERQNASDDKGIDYRELVDADDDTIKDLEKTSKEYGDRKYNDGLARAEFLNWNTSLKIDTPIVHQNHPQMKDARVRDSINNEYLNFVGFDEKAGTVERPDVSYADFVDARMEQAQAIAEAMSEKTRRNVTRQASRTGLRPDGSSAKRLDLTKAPQDMSDEELDAMIAKAGFAPKKR